MRALALLLSVLTSLLLALLPEPRSTAPLATVSLTPGWATFGQAFHEGAVRDAVQVGTLPTQTDVKTRWPDGSVRFAVVTARVDEDGAYQLQPGVTATDSFPETDLPEFWLALYDAARRQWYGTGFYEGLAESRWLDGPLCRELRCHLPVWDAQGNPHPFLMVVMDARAYRDGSARYDFTVENTWDQSGGLVHYHVYAGSGDATHFERLNVAHPYLTRWRSLLTLPTPWVLSDVTPDTPSLAAAGAVERYSANVENRIDWVWGPDFDILGRGSLHPWMWDHGGRPELAPRPDWTARYLAHRDPGQLAYVLAHGDLAGSWPIHVRGRDGSLVRIEERPDYWIDSRWRENGLDGPGGNLWETGALQPDIAHQPSLALVPYLLTGDRYYADEMAFWANYCVGGTYAPARAGMAYIHGNETRGFAWGLRNIADAAAYLPDSDSRKAYFAEAVQQNLDMCEWIAASPTAYGVAWHGPNLPPEWETGPMQFTVLWQHNYVAYAIDRANKLGFAGGETWKRQIAGFQSRWLKDPTTRDGAAPYRLITRANASGPFYQTFAQAYSYFGPTPFVGYYGVDARLSTLVAGDAAARQWIEARIAADLADRAGWYVE